MGIDTRWKEILRKYFPQCWHQQLPAKVLDINVYVIDETESVRNFGSNADSWKDLGNRCRLRLEEQLEKFPGIEQVFILLDGKSPRCKEIVQAKRDKDQNPFTEMEIKEIAVGYSPMECINGSYKTPPQYAFMKRLLSTRALRNQLYDFLCLHIAQIRARRNITITIDGGLKDSIEIAAEHYTTQSNIDLDEKLSKARCCAKVQCIIDIPIFKCGDACFSNREAPPECHNLHAKTSISRASWKTDPRVMSESDTKSIRYIVQMMKNGKKIFVKSTDTDWICIILLALRDCIADKKNFITGEVYLQTRTFQCKQEVKTVIDMVLLWRQMSDYIIQRFPAVENPIELMVFLMTLTGTDFVDRNKQITPDTVWEKFHMYGYQMIFQDFTSISDCKTPIGVQNPWGNEARIRHYVQNEYKTRDFIFAMYYEHIFKSPFSRLMDTHSRHKVKTVADERDAKKHVNHRCEIKEESEMIANARRQIWNINYWLNDQRACGHHDDPLKMWQDPQNPTEVLSEFGWVEEYDNVRKVKVVKRANRVAILPEHDGK